MSVPFKHVRLQHVLGTGDPIDALVYAQNVYAAVDRRMPEARGLATWLTASAMALGLSDAAVPEEWEGTFRSRRNAVPVEDWVKVGEALDAALTTPTRVLETPVASWIDELSRVLQLDMVSTRILALVLHYKFGQRVEELLDIISECRGGNRRLSRDAGLLGLLLDVPSSEVARCLMPSAKLLASGLLQLDRFGCLDVQDRLASLIRRDIFPAADFYDQLLGSSRPESLPWEAFAHLGQVADIAASVLRAALAGKAAGVSILLYGPPGTGKTSFAATLAARVGASLRPVAEADEEGGEPQRHDRLAGLRLAQRLAPPGGTVLLFDEAEDLFVRRGTQDDEPVTSSRVFIHRLLEELMVPVIWTANDISVLGPAVLRRMTMCLELKVPNLATRTRLWRRMGEAEGVVLQDTDAARLARLIPAAPAIASGAMRATRLAGGGAETARLIVEGVARAVRGGELPMPEKAPDAMYDPALVNADCDLAVLTADLLRPGATRAVSFLLSGPPGAGKSAWVRHLAGRMGMPVLHKRASDLLNPFVGGTEQNIAGAFAEAREAQAFLVFDEADSLLLERADAVRSWEITQVNEMLTWMEGHELPFACTTNLAERLDRASLRRFLVKLRFDWLTAAQARLAFRQFFGTAAPAGLYDLRTLTPADFALVRRRAAVRGGEPDPTTLLRLLKDECQGRVGARLPVGFGRPVARPWLCATGGFLARCLYSTVIWGVSGRPDRCRPSLRTRCRGRCGMLAVSPVANYGARARWLAHCSYPGRRRAGDVLALIHLGLLGNHYGARQHAHRADRNIGQRCTSPQITVSSRPLSPNMKLKQIRTCLQDSGDFAFFTRSGTVALHKLIELAKQGDKKASLAREHYGDRYDEYYMQRTSIDNDDDDDEQEPVVIDEDAPGLRRRVYIVCVNVGFLGVTALPSECDVIIVNGEVFVAGEDEFLAKFSPV